MDRLKSSLFYTDKYKRVERRIKDFLSKQAPSLSLDTTESTRTAGDATQKLLAENFSTILGPAICSKYYSDFSRKAMEDMAFRDNEGFYYAVDVKTHRVFGTKFNMPNITSVDKLARFYEDDKNYFIILMLKYEVQQTSVLVRDVIFVPIEFLDWDCLRIGALGWGQIQIANANVIKVNLGYSRKEWMVQFCDVLLDFYPKEAQKIMSKRVERFRQTREYWESHPE